MNRLAAKHYYETFVIALIVTLLPSRALGYLVPAFCLIWYLIRSKSGNTLKRLVIITLVYTVIITFYVILNQITGTDFLTSNAAVSLLTYGSFIFILLIEGDFVRYEHSYEKYARILSYATLIQGLVGIFQFTIVALTGRFDIIPGDAVQGTIGLLTFVGGEPGFGNQMLAINLVFFLVFLIPNVLVHRRGIGSFLIGLIALMLAGVLHIFISLVFSAIVTLFLYRRNLIFSNIGRLISAVVLAILLILPLGIIFPGVFTTANIFITLYSNQDSPKFEVVNRTVIDMPQEYPHVYLVGLGPGQYLSRAGLMSSGKYFDQYVPFFSNTISEPMKEYGYSIWNAYSSNTNRFGNSTMHRPFFSLLSIFAEFGLVFLIALFIYLIVLVYKMRKAYLRYRSNQQYQSAYLSFGVGLSFVFLLSISFFDNYLETTQAIFPGLLLVKAFYSSLRTSAFAQILPDKVEHKQQLLSRA